MIYCKGQFMVLKLWLVKNYHLANIVKQKNQTLRIIFLTIYEVVMEYSDYLRLHLDFGKRNVNYTFSEKLKRYSIKMRSLIVYLL